MQVRIEDNALAVVVLEDQREIEVRLTAILERNDEVPATHLAVIQIDTTDPELASLTPDDLRKRMRLLINEGTWCSHWGDLELGARRVAAGEGES